MVSLFSFIAYSFIISCSIATPSCWRNTSCNGPLVAAFPGTWDANIYAPESRTVVPRTILSSTLDIGSTYPDIPPLSANGSQVVFDFEKEVGGIVTVTYRSKGAAGILGFAFSEAKNFIGQKSDSSHGKQGNTLDVGDGAIFTSFDEGYNNYTMPDKSLRGGFRYLTVFLMTNSTTTVSIDAVSLEIAFSPTWSNLKAYQGYFHSNDELLNRIWYAGAYTLQTNTVPVNTGRWIPRLADGWANNGTLGNGDTIIVDGAKRDRAVWPGDMGIAVPSAFVSTGEMESVKNALQIMYDTQNNITGEFAESGPPLRQLGSDTYHMWSMIGTYNYILYTNDTMFLAKNWPKYLEAMNFIRKKVDSSGLLNVTDIRDWARWQQGFHNSEAQMILYKTLLTGADLAIWANEHDQSNVWTTSARNLAAAVNQKCWDDQYGAFKDNDTATALHPQDANSMAILFGLSSGERALNISKKLTKNWGPIGAVAPELPENISPFISSFELQGHLEIGATQRALDLLRLEWGWIINNKNSTESTLIEGYLQNGSFSYRSNRGYGYDASYTSHSHGWSAGPTSALTNYILGLDVTAPAGANYSLKPQFGDLTHVEGGFTTILGKFSASWTSMGFGYKMHWAVPKGTVGTIVLPCPLKGVFPNVKLDGFRIVRGVEYNKDDETSITVNFTVDENSIEFVTSAGGHSIEVS